MNGQVINLRDYRSYDYLKDPELNRTAKTLLMLRDQGRPKAEIIEILQISERHYWRLKAQIRAREGGTDIQVRGTDIQVRGGASQVTVKTKDSLMRGGLTSIRCVYSSSLSICSSSSIKSFKDKRDCKEKKGEEIAVKTCVPFQEIIDDLNKKSGKKYKATSKANQDLIKARWEDGYVLEDFYQLHTNMTVKWKKDARFNQYLRPETLYRRSHFEGYLNAMPIQNITHGMAETLADLEGEPVRKDHPLMSARIRAIKEEFEK